MSENGQRSFLILLAEDNRADAMLIKRSLMEHGVRHTMLILEDGEKAMEYFDRNEADEAAAVPDLLLLDLNLPRRSGHEILMRLREGAKSKRIPVMIVTSSDAAEDLEMARKLSTAYFQKVADLNEYMKIGAAVKKLLLKDHGEPHAR